MYEQLQLSLFEPPSFEELLDARGITTIRIIPRKRLKRGWHMKILPAGIRYLFIPASFTQASKTVKDALIDWAVLPTSRRIGRFSAQARHRKRHLESIIRVEGRTHGLLDSRSRPVDPACFSGGGRGTCHDLHEIFDYCNTVYFDKTIRAFVRWGSCGSLTSYQSIRHDPDGAPFNLITIAGVYDHPRVPRFAIEAVLFHEMLHVAIPPFTRNGRRVVHGVEFKKRERQFPLYHEWKKWERENLYNLRRSLKRKERKKTKTH